MLLQLKRGNDCLEYNASQWNSPLLCLFGSKFNQFLFSAPNFAFNPRGLEFCNDLRRWIIRIDVGSNVESQLWRGAWVVTYIYVVRHNTDQRILSASLFANVLAEKGDDRCTLH